MFKFLDINTHIRFEGNDRNAKVSFSNLEAFAGPARSVRGTSSKPTC